MSVRIAPEISVIIPVGERHADAAQICAEYRTGCAALKQTYELIFVLDGPQPVFARGLEALLANGERFTVVSLTRSFGEATAIMAGVSHATGQIIMTLPAYHQIEGSEIAKLVNSLGTNDVCVGRRWPRAGGPFERMRRAAFHRMLSFVTKLRFHDLACGARVFRRNVLDEIQLYGDQHRFLAVIAERHGFKVQEVELRQSPQDRRQGMYGPQEYVRSFLDIFSVFFLMRFTKRPLRFFGMVGVSTFSVGALCLALIVVERFFFDRPLADRPALLLSSLLIVLGLQIFALGLLGELIIFTHAREIKDYQVAEVIQFPGVETRPPQATSHEEKSAAAG
jgi:glycosyltransferase involved in cell wall biosynthesis